MATIEQVRERQEEIITRFQTQPFHRDQFTDTSRRLVANALEAPQGKRLSRRSRKQLPPPSKQAKDFILRALSNNNFLSMIERLAHE
jgi:hypothetical protein